MYRNTLGRTFPRDVTGSRNPGIPMIVLGLLVLVPTVAAAQGGVVSAGVPTNAAVPGAARAVGPPDPPDPPGRTVEIVANDAYLRPPLPARFLGTSYRDLWAAPITVEILDLDNTAGGLTLLRRGGGRQSFTLRFLGADGREYAFRSVDKVPLRATEPVLAGTLGGRILRDQVSSILPAAPLLAARLAHAAGVRHSPPRLVVMPDDPRLGDYREEFAGILGTFEEHPDELENGAPGFGGFDVIVGTDELLERLDEDPRQRVDAEAYLNARLLDLVLGDWDRRGDQWRWAQTGDAPHFVWRPIARDRDFAMADYDGLLLGLVRRVMPNAVRFTDDYRDLDGLVANARALDAWLLAPLGRATWDSIATSLASRLTDHDIDEAVRTLPGPYVAMYGDVLAAKLRARRDRLPEAAAAYYARLAEVPRVQASNASETAEVTRDPDGTVTVRLVHHADGRDWVTWSRDFDPVETREIRVYLRDGDDRAIVRGSATRGIAVRVIGGDGADTLTDSSTVTAAAPAGSWTSLHDDGASDQIAGDGRTWLDRHPRPVADADPAEGLPLMSFGDFGARMSVRPVADYSTSGGVVVGGAVTLADRRFGADPYASAIRLGVEYAPKWGTFAASADADFRPADPETRVEFGVRGSGLDVFRFYGFGNDTPASEPSDHYLIRPDAISGYATVWRSLGRGVEAGLGAVGRHSRYHPRPGGPFERLLGFGARSGVVGASAFLERVDDVTARDHTRLEASLAAAIYPIVTGVGGTFGTTDARAEAVLPVDSSGTYRVLARLGGRWVEGDFPVEDAAFLGGRETLRGYPSRRFAGDAMAFASLGLARRLGRFPLIVNWEVDAFAFGDVGRVFVGGERSDRWHSAPGLGLTFAVPFVAFEVIYARGDEGRFYLDLDLDL